MELKNDVDSVFLKMLIHVSCMINVFQFLSDMWGFVLCEVTLMEALMLSMSYYKRLISYKVITWNQVWNDNCWLSKLIVMEFLNE